MWLALGFAVASALGCDLACATPCPAGAIALHPSTNVENTVRSAPAGASFCFAAGLYRMISIIPRKHQRFFGEGKATLNGARGITKFTRDGGLWVASGQTQKGYRNGSTHCSSARPRCGDPEAFFIDNTPLLAVNKKSLVTPGTFFFDYPGDKIYFADDPAGKTVEASVAPYAFRGGAKGVVIDGLIVEKYSSPIQFAAVGYNMPSPNWIVRNSDIRRNYGLGVTVGTDSKLLNNAIYGNGEMGIGCVGDDILIEGNEIFGNGFFAGLDPAWEGGGGKCVLTNRLVFRGNYSHDNNSYGFWTDIDNINTLYENNRIDDNADGGISHEISYAATIRNNTLKGNGWAFNVWLWGSAILVQNSRDVDVHDNDVVITKAGNGISLIQQNRGSGKFGSHATANNFIHHNTIISRHPDTGAWGAIADYDPAGMKAANNRFQNNNYEVTSGNDDHWGWIDGFYSWNAYRKRSGQDLNSTLVVSP